jgi:hypothetical protein
MKVSRYAATGAAALTVLGRRSRALSAVAGATYLAGSLATRFGVFEAGLASAKDPKYVVIPQKERLARRQTGGAAAHTQGAGQGQPAG